MDLNNLTFKGYFQILPPSQIKKATIIGIGDKFNSGNPKSFRHLFEDN
jgi:hypothetical protein